MDAGYEEKTAWITLVSVGAVFTGYGVVAWRMWAAGVDVVTAYAPLFAVTVAALVLVMVVSHVVCAIANQRDRPGEVDERDRWIDTRAEARSGWIVGFGVIVALTGMVLRVDEVVVAHVLLGSLVLSELVKAALQLVAYRRGA